MAHLFKQMYLEDITDIEKQFTPAELTTAITIELTKRKIDELQRQKEIPISTTKTSYLVGGTTQTKRKSKLNNNKCGN